MARITVTLFLLLSFSYYVFAHGTCTTFDTDFSKCEILNSHTEPCTDSPHTSEKTNPETTFHACGCAGVFVTVENNSMLPQVSFADFGITKSNLIASEFGQRIERPPIAQA